MQRQQTEKEFLSSLKVIPVHFDSMPYGTGNQASSYNLMGRLRELGFKGKYEVLYYVGVNTYYLDGNPSQNKYITKDKIINLFNLPATMPDHYYDKEKNIEFIEGHVYYDKIKKKEQLHHIIAITGGQLKFCPEAVMTNGKQIIKDQAELDAIACKNDANALNVDLALRVEPWLGLNPTAAKSNLRISKYGEKDEIMFKEADHLFNNPPKSFTLEKTTAFLKELNQSSKLYKQKDGLLTLIEGSQQKKFHVMPFYAGPIKSDYDKFQGSHLYKMLHYIIGVKLAKNNGSHELQDKPILLPVFYDYMKEATSLQNIIKAIQNGQSELDNELSAFVASLNLDQCMLIKDITNGNIVETLETLSADKIVLLSIGNLPAPIFNSVFPQIATLSVLEGENTRNLVMAETSKPFLRAKEWFFSPYSYGPKEYCPNATLSERYAAYDKIDYLSSVDNYINSAKWVGQFIIDSLDEQSDVCQYFRWLHEQAIKPENDRVRYMLNKAITILTEDKKIPKVNSITQAFNNVYDGLLEKATSYAKNVVINCPQYFDHAPLGKPEKSVLSGTGLTFFNANRTCIPCLPAAPSVSRLT